MVREIVYLEECPEMNQRAWISTTIIPL